MFKALIFVLFAAAVVAVEDPHVYQPGKELMKELDEYGKLKEPTNNEGSSRIVNGNDVSISKHPWQISLRRQGSHICGGSILTATSILTAAHCVDGVSASSFTILAGSSSRLGSGQEIKVRQIITHENYNPSGDGFPNDIAILLLDSSLTFNTYVQPAKLPESSFYPSSNCVMTGWGRNNIDNALPVTLQEAFVDPISNSQCQRAMRGIFGATIHDYHICPHNGESMSCNGDSGGPYSCYDGSQYVLTGVTSWGIQSNGQCSLQHPSVYVRITHFLSWINQNKN